ncbi:hypothetical protein ES703_86269 [subsurface metagenome]
MRLSPSGVYLLIGQQGGFGEGAGKELAVTMDYGIRFDKAKQEVAEQCLKLFERLYRHTTLPGEFTITMSTQNRETGEVRESKTSIVIPKPISYNTMGRLTGKIRAHQISVINDSEGHFKVTIDGEEPKLSETLVEEDLGIPVQKKKTGGQVGYPSEPLGRAVWRYLADRYNDLDRSVDYSDEFVYYERSG